MNSDSTGTSIQTQKIPATGIWAVVVTFNRKTLLLGCLESLRRQSAELFGIIIVDNASDDGTHGVLYENGYILAPVSFGEGEICEREGEASSLVNESRIAVLYSRLARNEGGAGGFHEGVKKALGLGAEWIWFLDDDVEPEESCLERLLNYREQSGCIHPRKRFDNGTFYEWEAYLDVMTGNDVFLYDASFKNGKDLCFVNIGCFEGMLVNRNVVEKIGPPDKRFFIVYDDTIFGYLASRVTNVSYVRDAVMVKKLPLAQEMFTDSFIYYSMRNYFLKKEYLDLHAPRPLYRVMRRLNIAVVFLRFLFHVFFYKERKIKNLYHLCKGCRDGLTGRFGKGL